MTSAGIAIRFHFLHSFVCKPSIFIKHPLPRLLGFGVVIHVFFTTLAVHVVLVALF
jgi:hypothetical protein